MAAVLGVSAHYHDAAAALIVDGQLIAAISEERLSGIKNDASLPLRAIRECLRQAQLDAQDLSRVVFYENPYARFERTMVDLLRGFPRTHRTFSRALASQLGGRLWVLDALASALRVPRTRVTAVGHHESHAASAYFASGFPDAAVLTLDGVGERETTTMWHARGDTLSPIWSAEFPHSLGLLYAGITAYLGFEVNEGEYKVMGLAAYGAPTFEEEYLDLAASWKLFSGQRAHRAAHGTSPVPTTNASRTSPARCNGQPSVSCCHWPNARSVKPAVISSVSPAASP